MLQLTSLKSACHPNTSVTVYKISKNSALPKLLVKISDKLNPKDTQSQSKIIGCRFQSENIGTKYKVKIDCFQIETQNWTLLSILGSKEIKVLKWVIDHSFPRIRCQKFLILDISSVKILNYVSCFLLVIKKRILKYLVFFLKRDLDSQNSWFLPILFLNLAQFQKQEYKNILFLSCVR